MRKSLWYFFRDDVRRRIGGIVFCAEILLSVLGGLAARWAFKCGLIDVQKFDAIVTALLTYATISFGFCVAAVSIVINIPNARFAKKLATSRPKKKAENLDAYSDLLFIFGWTAIWHWVLIALTLLFQFWKPSAWHGWHFAIIGFITCYSLSLFLIMLLTITQFGNLYIKELRDEAADKQG